MSHLRSPAQTICLAVWLVMLTAPAYGVPAPERPPNIVFVLADDLGWTDLGCMGSKYYETPAIDRLAAGGMRFTDYYNCQNCTPTRAALMSGQYPPRTGIYSVGSLERGEDDARQMAVPPNETNLPLDRTTIAQSLKSAGFATGMFGKWHLGQRGEYHPKNRGFDEAIVSMGSHFNFKTDPKVDYPPGTYLADFLTDKSLDFIERHQHKPFFLYVAHFGVHTPYQAKSELIAKYYSQPASGGHQSAVYAAMIDSIDQSVGRIMAKLDELKLTENTLFIFSSDNGGVGGYGEIGGKGITNNAPLRGGKGMLYEGGVRVPFIVRGAGVAQPGSTCAEPAIHVDVYPTLLEIAGAKRPDHLLDGASLVPLLRDPTTRLDRDALYVHFPGYLEGYGTGNWRTTPVGTIRERDWKLLEFFEDGRLELYNLQNDIGETKNLATALPDRADELQAKLARWRKQVGAAMPTPKQEAPRRDARAAVGAKHQPIAGVATASSCVPATSPQGPTDGKRFSIEPASRWTGLPDQESWWWQVRFEQPRRVGSILQVIGDHPRNLMNAPRRYVWQTSDDGENWRDLPNTDIAGERRSFRVHRLSNPVATRYLRLAISESLGPSPTLREVEFYADVDCQIEFPDWIVSVSSLEEPTLSADPCPFTQLIGQCESWGNLMVQHLWHGDFDGDFVSTEPRPMCAFLSGSFLEWCQCSREPWRGVEQVLKNRSLPMWGACGGAQILAILEETGVDKPWDCPRCRDPKNPKLPVYSHIGHTGPAKCGDYTQCIGERGKYQMQIVASDPVLEGLPDVFEIMESHVGQIAYVPDGWIRLVTKGPNAHTVNQLLRVKDHLIYAAQFHMEMAGTPENSQRIMSNFLKLAQQSDGYRRARGAVSQEATTKLKPTE